jgi:glycosyltransferase 2 family protein
VNSILFSIDGKIKQYFPAFDIGAGICYTGSLMETGKRKGKWQTAGGIAISLLFLFLAARRVDAAEMLRALREADYMILLPLLAAVGLGLFLRSLRWRFLLAPIAAASTGALFKSLSIGYMVNTFMPAHLGEFVRAWHAARRTGIASGSVFATIVVERLIDVVSLLLLLGLALLVFPFPGWVRQSGAVMLAVVAALSVLLLVMKKNQQKSLAACGRLLGFLPGSASARVREMLGQFLCGVSPLRRRSHYAMVAALSLLIWLSYALTYQLLFLAFGFVARYRLPWSAALVAMVITTISVVVPSSPGYIGTFHFLCQLALGLFLIPKGPALSYAFVLHALSVFPVFFLGLYFLAREKLSLRSLRQEEIHAPGH